MPSTRRALVRGSPTRPLFVITFKIGKAAMLRRRCHRVLYIVPFLFAALSLHSQTTAAPDSSKPVTTIKTKVRLVLVDVVATNSKGEPVTGLHKGDFELLEDGKPQAIASFEEHKGAPLQQIKLPPMPPNVYTNFPATQSADSVNVLLLDSLNTPAPDQVYVHSEMIKHLKEIPANTRVAVFTLASRLRMLQGITTDSSALLAAVNQQIAAQPSPLLQSQMEKDANEQFINFLMKEQQGPPTANQTIAQQSVDAVSAEKAFQSDTKTYLAESRTAITLEAMQQLARYLSTVPGRKNVIWFSGSFPAGILPNPDVPDPFSGQRDFQWEIRKTSDLLAAAQIAIYPVGAEGLAADPAFAPTGIEISEKRGSISMQDTIQKSRDEGWDRDSGHASMEQLARETGGQAFYNANGLGEIMQRAINNGQHYYSLTYSPTNAEMDGKYRRIQVKLTSGKHSLAYRRGYFADDLESALAAGQKPDNDLLLPLMGRNLPDYTQILYKIKVAPSNPQPPPDAPRAGTNTDLKPPLTRYAVDFAVSVQDLKLESTPDGAHHGSIEVALLAYDREGKPLNFVVTKSALLVPANAFPGLQKVGLQIHKEIDVPNGYAYLRTGVYDFKSSTAGTLGVPLPDSVAAAAK